MSEVLDKVKIWLKNEVKANDKYGDDPTGTADDLLTKIKDWEKEKTNAWSSRYFVRVLFCVTDNWRGVVCVVVLVEEILKNRKDFPEVAKLVDALRRQLGDVKVLWCQEGHRQLGTRLDDEIEGSQTR